VWSESWPFNSWWRHNILYWMDLVVFHRDVGLPEGSKRVVTPNSQLMASWMVGCAIIEVYYFRAFCFQIGRQTCIFFVYRSMTKLGPLLRWQSPLHRYPERLSWSTTPEFHKIGMEPEKWSLKGDFPTKKGSIYITFMFYVFL
jgi:hypothetical protein